MCDKNGINETGNLGIGVVVLYRTNKKKLSIKRALLGLSQPRDKMKNKIYGNLTNLIILNDCQMIKLKELTSDHE
tara:strand:- start:7206 stop:7430 length:225 start_codon:yes stop_codon:yes gene_type:complete